MRKKSRISFPLAICLGAYQQMLASLTIEFSAFFFKIGKVTNALQRPLIDRTLTNDSFELKQVALINGEMK